MSFTHIRCSSSGVLHKLLQLALLHIITTIDPGQENSTDQSHIMSNALMLTTHLAHDGYEPISGDNLVNYG